jgi:hypothetical protein
MTPSAIRLVSQLRQEFYARFAASMTVPVSITSRNSYISNLSTASWVDTQQQLNYLYIYAHTAPDVLIPDRPLVLRVALNKGAGIGVMSKQGRGVRGLNRYCQFELTLLPEEILDFLPWIVDLIQAYDRPPSDLIPDPPHPLNVKLSSALQFDNAQTHQAISLLAQPVAPQETIYAPCRAAGFGG